MELSLQNRVVDKKWNVWIGKWRIYNYLHLAYFLP